MAALSVRPVAVEATRPLRQAVLRPHLTVDEMAGSEPDRAFAVAAFDGEELVGVGLIGPEGDGGEWRIRGMATAPAARGRGVGTAVLAALLGHATSRGASGVWASARDPARSLYERAGMRVDSEEFEVAKIGPHVIMRMELPG